MKEYRALYKEYYKKSIVWSEIDKITAKEFEQLKAKMTLIISGISKEQIEESYDLLNKNR